MAHSAATAALVESFQETAKSIVDLSINRQETREALAAGPRSGIRKLAGRLIHGVRQLVDIADRQGTSSIGSPLLTERLSGSVKKLAVKAGASIIVDAVVPMIPLGWLSFASFAVRPILRRLLYAASDMAIDLMVNFRKGNV